MNFMDLVPVDLFPKLLSYLGVQDFRCVPTADAMITFGLSLPVFFLIIIYNLRAKGFKGLGKEILVSPFGAWLFPINIVFRGFTKKRSARRSRYPNSTFGRNILFRSWM